MIKNIKKAIERIRTPRLNAVKFGLAGGIVTGLCVLLTTIYALVTGQGLVWIVLLNSIYGFLGYDVSILGAILGAVYSFVDGFILTWMFALIYNKLL